MAVQSPAELVQKKCKPCEGGVKRFVLVVGSKGAGGDEV